MSVFFDKTDIFYNAMAMTGAEFNERMAGIKLYKLLNHNLKHYGYTYEPNALNSLDKTGETFNPDMECGPGGLYFCRESDILRWASVSFGYQNIAPVVIPADSKVSICSHKFKTDKLILGKPVKFEEFFSNSYITNMPVSYLSELNWRKQTIWNIVKRRYRFAIDKFNEFDNSYWWKLVCIAVWIADIKFLDSIQGDMMKLLRDSRFDNSQIKRLALTPHVPMLSLQWLIERFLQTV